ncbi:ArsR family transcriptional regulator [Paenibacillus sp. PL91]|uniref:ArsR family transcriptional regulator n=1 Tax=Paenibacillus sp. PL91 TaxID=2729538 RepID=UPI00145C69FE|nr:ArsR family transcriptional regulator [Paenibacillus sp. PL91]
MGNTNHEVKAKFIRGFSNKTRLQILESIKNREKTVSEIVDDLKGTAKRYRQPH